MVVALLQRNKSGWFCHLFEKDTIINLSRTCFKIVLHFFPAVMMNVKYQITCFLEWFLGCWFTFLNFLHHHKTFFHSSHWAISFLSFFFRNPSFSTPQIWLQNCIFNKRWSRKDGNSNQKKLLGEITPTFFGQGEIITQISQFLDENQA